MFIENYAASAVGKIITPGRVPSQLIVATTVGAVIWARLDGTGWRVAPTSERGSAALVAADPASRQLYLLETPPGILSQQRYQSEARQLAEQLQVSEARQLAEQLQVSEARQLAEHLQVSEARQLAEQLQVSPAGRRMHSKVKQKKVLSSNLGRLDGRRLRAGYI